MLLEQAISEVIFKKKSIFAFYFSKFEFVSHYIVANLGYYCNWGWRNMFGQEYPMKLIKSWI